VHHHAVASADFHEAGIENSGVVEHTSSVDKVTLPTLSVTSAVAIADARESQPWRSDKDNI